MNDTTYNGWTNYETWCVKLWMDNDYGMWEMQEEMAQQADDVNELREALEAWCDELQELESLPTTGMFADLLGAALSEVNWHEIAESIWDDCGRDNEGE